MDNTPKPSGTQRRFVLTPDQIAKLGLTAKLQSVIAPQLKKKTIPKATTSKTEAQKPRAKTPREKSKNAQAKTPSGKSTPPKTKSAVANRKKSKIEEGAVTGNLEEKLRSLYTKSKIRDKILEEMRKGVQETNDNSEEKRSKEETNAGSVLEENKRPGRKRKTEATPETIKSNASANDDTRDVTVISRRSINDKKYVLSKKSGKSDECRRSTTTAEAITKAMEESVTPQSDSVDSKSDSVVRHSLEGETAVNRRSRRSAVKPETRTSLKTSGLSDDLDCIPSAMSNERKGVVHLPPFSVLKRTKNLKPQHGEQIAVSEDPAISNSEEDILERSKSKSAAIEECSSTIFNNPPNSTNQLVTRLVDDEEIKTIQLKTVKNTKKITGRKDEVPSTKTFDLADKLATLSKEIIFIPPNKSMAAKKKESNQLKPAQVVPSIDRNPVIDCTGTEGTDPNLAKAITGSGLKIVAESKGQSSIDVLLRSSSIEINPMLKDEEQNLIKRSKSVRSSSTDVSSARVLSSTDVSLRRKSIPTTKPAEPAIQVSTGKVIILNQVMLKKYLGKACAIKIGEASKSVSSGLSIKPKNILNDAIADKDKNLIETVNSINEDTKSSVVPISKEEENVCPTIEDEGEKQNETISKTSVKTVTTEDENDGEEKTASADKKRAPKNQRPVVKSAIAKGTQKIDHNRAYHELVEATTEYFQKNKLFPLKNLIVDDECNLQYDLTKQDSDVKGDAGLNNNSGRTTFPIESNADDVHVSSETSVDTTRKEAGKTCHPNDGLKIQEISMPSVIEDAKLVPSKIKGGTAVSSNETLPIKAESLTASTTPSIKAELRKVPTIAFNIEGKMRMSKQNKSNEESINTSKIEVDTKELYKAKIEAIPIDAESKITESLDKVLNVTTSRHEGVLSSKDLTGVQTSSEDKTSLPNIAPGNEDKNTRIKSSSNLITSKYSEEKVRSSDETAESSALPISVGNCLEIPDMEHNTLSLDRDAHETSSKASTLPISVNTSARMEDKILSLDPSIISNTREALSSSTEKPSIETSTVQGSHAEESSPGPETTIVEENRDKISIDTERRETPNQVGTSSEASSHSRASGAFAQASKLKSLCGPVLGRTLKRRRIPNKPTVILKRKNVDATNPVEASKIVIEDKSKIEGGVETPDEDKSSRSTGVLNTRTIDATNSVESRRQVSEVAIEEKATSEEGIEASGGCNNGLHVGIMEMKKVDKSEALDHDKDAFSKITDTRADATPSKELLEESTNNLNPANALLRSFAAKSGDEDAIKAPETPLRPSTDPENPCLRRLSTKYADKQNAEVEDVIKNDNHEGSVSSKQDDANKRLKSEAPTKKENVSKESVDENRTSSVEDATNTLEDIAKEVECTPKNKFEDLLNPSLARKSFRNTRYQLENNSTNVDTHVVESVNNLEDSDVKKNELARSTDFEGTRETPSNCEVKTNVDMLVTLITGPNTSGTSISAPNISRRSSRISKKKIQGVAVVDTKGKTEIPSKEAVIASKTNVDKLCPSDTSLSAPSSSISEPNTSRRISRIITRQIETMSDEAIGVPDNKSDTPSKTNPEVTISDSRTPTQHTSRRSSRITNKVDTSSKAVVDLKNISELMSISESTNKEDKTIIIESTTNNDKSSVDGSISIEPITSTPIHKPLSIHANLNTSTPKASSPPPLKFTGGNEFCPESLTPIIKRRSRLRARFRDWNETKCSDASENVGSTSEIDVSKTEDAFKSEGCGLFGWGIANVDEEKCADVLENLEKRIDPKIIAGNVDLSFKSEKCGADFGRKLQVVDHKNEAGSKHDEKRSNSATIETENEDIVAKECELFSKVGDGGKNRMASKVSALECENNNAAKKPCTFIEGASRASKDKSADAIRPIVTNPADSITSNSIVVTRSRRLLKMTTNKTVGRRPTEENLANSKTSTSKIKDTALESPENPNTTINKDASETSTGRKPDDEDTCEPNTKGVAPEFSENFNTSLNEGVTVTRNRRHLRTTMNKSLIDTRHIETSTVEVAAELPEKQNSSLNAGIGSTRSSNRVLNIAEKKNSDATSTLEAAPGHSKKPSEDISIAKIKSRIASSLRMAANKTADNAGSAEKTLVSSKTATRHKIKVKKAEEREALKTSNNAVLESSVNVNEGVSVTRCRNLIGGLLKATKKKVDSRQIEVDSKNQNTSLNTGPVSTGNKRNIGGSKHSADEKTIGDVTSAEINKVNTSHETSDDHVATKEAMHVTNEEKTDTVRRSIRARKSVHLTSFKTKETIKPSRESSEPRPKDMNGDEECRQAPEEKSSTDEGNVDASTCKRSRNLKRFKISKTIHAPRQTSGKNFDGPRRAKPIRSAPAAGRRIRKWKNDASPQSSHSRRRGLVTLPGIKKQTKTGRRGRPYRKVDMYLNRDFVTCACKKGMKVKRLLCGKKRVEAVEINVSAENIDKNVIQNLGGNVVQNQDAEGAVFATTKPNENAVGFDISSNKEVVPCTIINLAVSDGIALRSSTENINVAEDITKIPNVTTKSKPMIESKIFDKQSLTPGKPDGEVVGVGRPTVNSSNQQLRPRVRAKFIELAENIKPIGMNELVSKSRTSDDKNKTRRLQSGEKSSRDMTKTLVLQRTDDNREIVEASSSKKVDGYIQKTGEDLKNSCHNDNDNSGDEDRLVIVDADEASDCDDAKDRSLELEDTFEDRRAGTFECKRVDPKKSAESSILENATRKQTVKRKPISVFRKEEELATEKNLPSKAIIGDTVVRTGIQGKSISSNITPGIITRSAGKTNPKQGRNSLKNRSDKGENIKTHEREEIKQQAGDAGEIKTSTLGVMTPANSLSSEAAVEQIIKKNVGKAKLKFGDLSSYKKEDINNPKRNTTDSSTECEDIKKTEGETNSCKKDSSTGIVTTSVIQNDSNPSQQTGDALIEIDAKIEDYTKKEKDEVTRRCAKLGRIRRKSITKPALDITVHKCPFIKDADKILQSSSQDGIERREDFKDFDEEISIKDEDGEFSDIKDESYVECKEGNSSSSFEDDGGEMQMFYSLTEDEISSSTNSDVNKQSIDGDGQSSAGEDNLDDGLLMEDDIVNSDDELTEMNEDPLAKAVVQHSENQRIKESEDEKSTSKGTIITNITLKSSQEQFDASRRSLTQILKIAREEDNLLTETVDQNSNDNRTNTDNSSTKTVHLEEEESSRITRPKIAKNEAPFGDCNVVGNESKEVTISTKGEDQAWLQNQSAKEDFNLAISTKSSSVESTEETRIELQKSSTENTRKICTSNSSSIQDPTTVRGRRTSKSSEDNGVLKRGNTSHADLISILSTSSRKKIEEVPPGILERRAECFIIASTTPQSDIVKTVTKEVVESSIIEPHRDRKSSSPVAIQMSSDKLTKEAVERESESSIIEELINTPHKIPKSKSSYVPKSELDEGATQMTLDKLAEEAVGRETECSLSPHNERKAISSNIPKSTIDWTLPVKSAAVLTSNKLMKEAVERVAESSIIEECSLTPYENRKLTSKLKIDDTSLVLKDANQMTSDKLTNEAVERELESSIIKELMNTPNEKIEESPPVIKDETQMTSDNTNMPLHTPSLCSISSTSPQDDSSIKSLTEETAKSLPKQKGRTWKQTRVSNTTTTISTTEGQSESDISSLPRATTPQTETAETLLSSETIKQRGRPRKTVQTFVPKTMSTTITTEEDMPSTTPETVIAETPIPKRRGRPKKSLQPLPAITTSPQIGKRKRTSVNYAALNEGSDEDFVTPQPVLKKIKTETPTDGITRKKRGRPRKVITPIQDEETDRAASDLKSQPDAELVEERLLEQTEKNEGKKKYLLVLNNAEILVTESPKTNQETGETFNLDINHEEAPISKSRRKGRPRKVIIGEENMEISPTLNEYYDNTSARKRDSNEVECGEEQTPKKRGRKPRKKLQMENSEENEEEGAKVVKKKLAGHIDVTAENETLHELQNRLLVRNLVYEMRGLMVLAEKEDDGQEADKGSVKCALCRKIVKTNDWFNHKQKQHNNLAWAVGEPELDLNNVAFVINTLWKIYMKKKPFFCYKCSESKKSVIGLLGHVMQCNRSETELEEFKVECTTCSLRLMPYSYVEHMKCHKIQEEKRKAAAEISKQQLIEEEFSPGRKREAAKRASYLIQTVSNDANEMDKYATKRYYTIKKEKIADSEYENYITKEGDSVLCAISGCNNESKSLEEAQEHFRVCKSSQENKYCCKFCESTFTNKQAFDCHFERVHSDEIAEDSDFEQDGSEPDLDGEQQLRSRRSRAGGSSDTWQSYQLKFLYEALYVKGISLYLNHWCYSKHLEFCEENFKNDFNLFANVEIEWTPLDKSLIKDYLPKLKRSMYVNNEVSPQGIFSDGYNGDQPFKKYKLFESELQPAGYDIIFCGGPISTMSWVPTPHTREGCQQILAVGIIPDPDKGYSVAQLYDDKSVIQFWNLGVLDINSGIATAPKLEFCLAHEHGPIWGMEWCPSGCYRDNQLGLVAVSGTDSVVYGYRIPQPEVLSGIMYKADPIFKLILSKVTDFNVGGHSFYATRISWSKALGHQHICVGYSNGVVSVFDLDPSSDWLKAEQEGVLVYYPYVTFQGHNAAVTGVALYHMSGGNKWLATASSDRTVKFWNLEDAGWPISTKKKSQVKEFVWMNNWICTVDAHDDWSNPILQTTSLTQLREFAAQHCNIVMYSYSSVNSISASDWGNIVVQGNLMGELIGCYIKHLLPFTVEVPAKRFFMSHTKLLPNKGVNIKENVDRNEFHDYKTTSDNTSLVFVDFDLKCYKKVMKPSEACTSHRGSYEQVKMDMYPIQSITNVRVNPNRHCFLYTAVGYQTGFVRLVHSKFLSTKS